MVRLALGPCKLTLRKCHGLDLSGDKQQTSGAPRDSWHPAGLLLGQREMLHCLGDQRPQQDQLCTNREPWAMLGDSATSAIIRAAQLLQVFLLAEA